MGSILIIIAIAFAILLEVYTWKAGIVPMPTISRVQGVMVNLLPKKIEGEIWELGSGWGGILIALAKKYPSNHIIGYELSPLPYWFSKLRLLVGRYKNITVYRKNFMEEDFDKASAFLCYLSPHHMRDLEPKFKNEVSSGTIVISNTFPLPLKKPDETIVSKGFWQVKIFKYCF